MKNYSQIHVIGCNKKPHTPQKTHAGGVFSCVTCGMQ